MVAPLEFVKAVGVGIVLIAFLGGIGWMFNHFMGKLFKKIRYTFKKWEEKDVEWCMEAVETGLDHTGVRKFLLVHDYPQKRVEDMVYLFEKVKRKMKGGKAQDE